MHISQDMDGVHLHVRTCTGADVPAFRISGTVGRIALKFGRWLKTRDATFPQKAITGTAPHHQITNNYQRLPADYVSLLANYRHVYGFHYKRCLQFPAIY